MICTNKGDFDNTIGVTIDEVDHFIVAKDNYVIMYDDHNFQE